MDDLATKPYAQWLEDTVKELFDIDPVAISMQMRKADGSTYTCYWDVTPDDRAIMLDAMREDGYIDFIRNNKDEIKAIFEEDEEEDDECEGDS